MANAKLISLTCDGAVDWTWDEFESLYLRTSIRGTIYQRFLGLKSPATLDAIGVCNAMLCIAGNFADMMAKLVGWGQCHDWKDGRCCGFAKKNARRADWCTLFGSSLGTLF